MNYKHYIHNYILNPQHELSVAVIGCGGTGSQVLTSLGRMNYTLKKLGHPGLHIVVYDADIVTEANCGRQLFSEQEIGHNKADVLVTKLNAFFGTRWDSIPEMYTSTSDTANIIVSCVDTVKSRITISKKLAEQSFLDYSKVYYWIDFGNTVDSGQVVLGTAGREHNQPKGRRCCVGFLPSVSDLYDLPKLSDKKSGPSCSLADALTKQDLFINSTLSQAGMALMWKMFNGVIDIHGVYLNVSTMRMNPIRIVRHTTKTK